MTSPFQFGIFAILIILLLLNLPETSSNETPENFWLETRKFTSVLLQNCLGNSVRRSQTPHTVLSLLQDCLKRKSFQVFDSLLDQDVIELLNGIKLVRYRSDKRNFDFDYNNTDWKTQFIQRIDNVLQTHILKVHFNNTDNLTFQGRHRRHRNMMMPLMVFGMMALGMIMIPMGFQFLAVLGGKALLLAKMALILTSIQGLKKIATSNVNYGLYSTPGHGCKDGSLTLEYDTLHCDGDDVFVSFDVEDLSSQGHYDRQWPHEHDGPDAGASSNAYNYYYQNVPPPQEHQHNIRPDLLHPRVDALRNNY